MKLEGDYAVDGWRRGHRIASVCAVLLMAAGVWYLTGLPGKAAWMLPQCAVPLAVIWFADELALYRGGLKGGGWAWRISAESPGRPLRWAGWFLLAMIGLRWLVAFWR